MWYVHVPNEKHAGSIRVHGAASYQYSGAKRV